jgi:hypothetical protein
MYADDVILFAHPSANEATAIRELLWIFGDASKCSITEIYGAQDNLADIQQILGCQIAQFPIRYLELPLSTSKIPKAAVQYYRGRGGQAPANLPWPTHGQKREASLDKIGALGSSDIQHDR